MSNRTFAGVQAVNKEVKILPGRFDVSGVIDPDGVVGMGFTVARTGVGVFTVTPTYICPNSILTTDSYPAYLSFTCSGEVALTSVIDPATGIATITATAGEPADNSQISFLYIVQNTSNPAV